MAAVRIANWSQFWTVLYLGDTRAHQHTHILGRWQTDSTCTVTRATFSQDLSRHRQLLCPRLCASFLLLLVSGLSLFFIHRVCVDKFFVRRLTWDLRGNAHPSDTFCRLNVLLHTQRNGRRACTGDPLRDPPDPTSAARAPLPRRALPFACPSVLPPRHVPASRSLGFVLPPPPFLRFSLPRRARVRPSHRWCASAKRNPGIIKRPSPSLSSAAGPPHQSATFSPSHFPPRAPLLISPVFFRVFQVYRRDFGWVRGFFFGGSKYTPRCFFVPRGATRAPILSFFRCFFGLVYICRGVRATLFSLSFCSTCNQFYRDPLVRCIAL